MVLPREVNSMMNDQLEDFLKKIAQQYTPFGKSARIDGVVCLANSNDDSEQVVLKVHYKTSPAQPVVPRPAYKEPIPLPVVLNFSNTASNDIPQDLRLPETQRLARLAVTQASIQRAVELHGVRPQALQLVNKPSNVTSLLYQKITGGGGNNKKAVPEPMETGRKEEGPEEEPALGPEEILCPVCSETVYGGFPVYEKHVIEVHCKYPCKLCYKVFTQRCNARRHERLHKSEKPFPCNFCNKAFSRSCDLRSHVRRHAKDALSQENQSKALENAASPVRCSKCVQIFDAEEALRWHMYRYHRTQDDKWLCTICEQLFLSQEAHEEHKMTHIASLHQHKPAAINISEDENTNDDQVMRDEYQRDLVIDESQRTASSPDESSNESQPQEYPSIKRALETKPSTSSRKRRKGNPIKHVQNATDLSDDEDDSYLEPTYGPLQVETMNPVSSMSPAQSVSSENDPLLNSFNSDVVASSSGRRYSRDFELPSHPLENLQTLAQIHPPVVIQPEHTMSLSSIPDPYPASPSCESPALSHLSANNSLNDSATSGSLNPLPPAEDDAYEDKEYTCSWDGCSMQFIGFKNFEAHSLEQHKRFPCHLCKQTFSGKNNRTRHTRNHNRDKLYPCPDCGKKFSRPDSMREHRFTHTRSYQEDRCRRCGLEFDKKSKLLAHLKKCFHQHRTKNGSIDESCFDIPNAINGNNVEESPSGLTLGGIKLENNNEPMHPFLMKGVNGLPEQSILDLGSPNETAHIAKVAAITRALVHTPPEAHMDTMRTSPAAFSTHSPPQSAQDLSSTAPESPVDLVKSAPESPLDLANKVPESAAAHTQPIVANGSVNAGEESAVDVADVSQESDMKLADIAANNNTGEKPLDLAAIEAPKDKVQQNGVPSVPMMATS